MDLFNVLAHVTNATLLLVSIVALVLVIKGLKYGQILEKFFLVLISLNIIITVLNITWMDIHYNYYLIKFIATLTYLSGLGIFLLNIEILQVFSVLNENITAKKIKCARIFLIVYYFLTNFGLIAALFWLGNSPNYLQPFITFGGYLFLVSGVIYDNLQTFYLTILIRNNKKSRGRGQLSAKSESALVKMFLVSVSFTMFDWVGVGLYTYITTQRLAANFDSDYQSIKVICQFIQGTHATGMILSLHKLSDLVFADRKVKVVKPSEEYVQTVQVNAATGEKVCEKLSKADKVTLNPINIL
ncbi:hypothetical protein HDV06_005871 [Boothiomyces sp. JEL0866]|nr:hypothetical protein HDV06_005871 [Boothiomyces sp. JEL0866]